MNKYYIQDLRKALHRNGHLNPLAAPILQPRNLCRQCKQLQILFCCAAATKRTCDIVGDFDFIHDGIGGAHIGQFQRKRFRAADAKHVAKTSFTQELNIVKPAALQQSTKVLLIEYVAAPSKLGLDNLESARAINGRCGCTISRN